MRETRLGWLFSGANPAVALVLIGFLATPASAVHFFDNCQANLSPADPNAAANVLLGNASGVIGTFTDEATGLPLTQVTAGQTVNFTWDDRYCHSVTLVPDGLAPPNLMETNPILSKASVVLGVDFDSTQIKFPEPGIYGYYCEHHWPVGMIGMVVVTPAE